jgi:hypothetical protein
MSAMKQDSIGHDSNGLFVGAGLALAAGGTWAISLIQAGGVGNQTLGFTMLFLSMVGVLGMVLSRGRWSLRLTLAVQVLLALMALVTRVGWWQLGSTLAVIALGVLSTERGTQGMRRLPVAEPIPDQAVLLPLAMLALPGLAAIFHLEIFALNEAGWPLMAWAIGIWVLAAAYSRAGQPALWLIRLAVLPLTIAVALSFDLVPALVTVVASAAIVGLAWHPQALKAITDAAPRLVSPVAVPPELVPEDLMNAAGYDSSGRRLPSQSDGGSGG